MVFRDRFLNLELEKQQRILNTAIEEFASQGFRQASINRMVQRLGIAKGSIFQYFGTKEGLFKVVFNYAVDLVKRSLRRVRDVTSDTDFFERIRQSLIAGIQFIDKHPQVYRIYLKMMFQEDFPLRAEFLQKVHLFSADYLDSLVKEGMARGQLRSDLDVKAAVFFLDALMDRFLQAYSVSFLDASSGLYQAREDQILRMVDQFIQVLRHGMGAEPRQNQRVLEQREISAGDGDGAGNHHV
jgi:TetR/AcrR family transcriptional regulator